MENLEIPVLRNAGGRIKNSIIDAVTLDTIVNVHEIVIMHHTGEC
jgi:carbonic anhydrase